MKRILNILYFIALFTAITFGQTSWYVNKNATGLNNGTSWTNGWESFADINWASISPGDYVYISGGTDSIVYYELLQPTAGGTQGNYLHIFAGRYAPSPSGHSGKVIIDGQSVRENILVQSITDTWFRGFELRNSEGNAFNMDGQNTQPMDRIIIDSLRIVDFNQGGFDPGAGIRIVCKTDSTIVRNCFIRDLVGGSGQSDIVHINKDGTYYLPTRLIFYNNFFHSRSQDPQAHNDAFQSIGCDGFIIYNNISINDSVNSPEGGGMPFILSDVDYGDDNPVIVFNNLCYMGGVWMVGANFGKTFNTRHDGVGGADATNQPSKVFVFNNTFLSNGPTNSVMEMEYLIHFFSNNILASWCPTNRRSDWHHNLSGENSSSYTGQYHGYLHVDSTRNNLIWREDDTQTGLFAGDQFEKGTGTLFTPTDWSSWVSNGGTGVNDDPELLFQVGHEPDQGSVIPDVAPTSPAINAGDDLTYLVSYFQALGIDAVTLDAMTKDFYGNERSDWDIGAFEYVDGLSVDSLPNAFTFTDVTNAELSQGYESNGVTLAGFDSAWCYAGGQEFTVYQSLEQPPYTWRTAGIRVFPDDIIKVRRTSSSSYSTAVNTTLTVGSRSDTYTITTKSAPAPSGGSKVLKTNGGILKDSTGKIIKTQ